MARGQPCDRLELLGRSSYRQLTHSHLLLNAPPTAIVYTENSVTSRSTETVAIVAEHFYIQTDYAKYVQRVFQFTATKSSKHSVTYPKAVITSSGAASDARGAPARVTRRDGPSKLRGVLY
ncbi:hypothetical protein EVAR_13441_1 [Eumeta japonica]|uniref:Uncharacterized protein n=1 Tax=Eumeta variegata TaxID=151549 RepID=A0A4C1V7L8_EUMVA|nr:hypothetical protein EVAR_13441_1 [Eumeta japonica]